MGNIADCEELPWVDEPADSLFRLPGFEGCAFTVGSTVVRDNSGEFAFGVDLGLLTPDRWVTYFAREVEGTFIDSLAAFLWSCASDIDVSTCSSEFVDLPSGIKISVATASDFKVELRFEIKQVMAVCGDDSELGDTEPELDVVIFTTSRVALATAREHIHRLDGSKVEDENVKGEK